MVGWGCRSVAEFRGPVQTGLYTAPGWYKTSRVPLRITASSAASVRALAALVVTLGLSALVPACKGEGEAMGGRAPAAAPVIVVPVERKAMPVAVNAVGSVEAFTTVSVLAQVGGEIKSVHFKEGQVVHKGDLLFTIDTRPYRASLSEAVARVAKDRALAKQAHDEADRAVKLAKEGLATQQDLDRAQSSAAAADATLGADRAAAAGASVSVSYATIRSPIDGRTGSLLVHAGNVVKPNDKTLVVIREVHPVYVRFAVPEQYLARVRMRMKAGELTVVARPRADGADPARGVLTFVENTVDSSTGTVDLKAEFKNVDERLWPGQLVDVSLELTVDQNAIVVPEAAIQVGQNGDHVFVVGKDDKAELRKVHVARQVGAEVVIASGVTPGEKVVTDGQVRLTPGAKVLIKKSEPPALATPETSSSAGAPKPARGPEDKP